MSAIDFNTDLTNRISTTARPRMPRFGLMLRVARERRALLGLSDVGLADLGLTREDAMREACRPIWDLPATR